MIQTTIAGGFYNPATLITSNKVVGGTGSPNLTQVAGESFSLAGALTASGIILQLKKIGSPADALLIEILTGSIDAGSVIGMATVPNVSILTTSMLPYQVSFAAPVSLASNTTYYIRITRSPDTQDTSNYVDVGGDGHGNIYTQGTFWYRYNNVWHQDSGDDLYFGLLQDVSANVVRLALPGYNAKTDTDLDHFSVYSDIDNILIKGFKKGAQNINDPVYPAGYTDLTVAHGLGYIPLFLAFHDQFGDGTWSPINNQYNLFSVPEIITGADTSNLTIRNFGGHGAGHVAIAYDIFYDNMTVGTPPDMIQSPNIFKVARPGVDASLSKNPNDYIMHSDLNNFKILKSGLVTNFTIPNTTYTASYAHGANVQTPYKFLIFVQDYAQRGDGYAWLAGNAIGLDWFESEGITVTMDGTNINFRAWNTATSTVIEFFYIIYGTGKTGTILTPGNELAVAAPGKNVVTETNPENFNFHSAYPTLKYYVSGAYSFTATNTTVITIPHNLGYVPVVVGFVNDIAGTISSGYAICPYYFGRSSLGSPNRDVAAFVYADATNIYLKAYYQPNAVGTSFTFSFQYKIFKNKTGL